MKNSCLFNTLLLPVLEWLTRAIDVASACLYRCHSLVFRYARYFHSPTSKSYANLSSSSTLTRWGKDRLQRVRLLSTFMLLYYSLLLVSRSTTHTRTRARARRTQKLSIKGIKSQTLLPHYDLYKPNSFRINTIRLHKSITRFMRRSYQTYEKLSNRTRCSSQTTSKN